jgi:hypothetical protein
MPASRTAIRVTDYGSICIARVLTAEARDWACTRLHDDALRWGRDGLVIERRCLAALVQGARADGLTVEG